jgi:ribosome biogenesis GTPase A
MPDFCLAHAGTVLMHAVYAMQMDELPLLRDAITNLDDVFLVVVVGEFNSGKSTVINALLGEKFLADGILPTTNEISVLK